MLEKQRFKVALLLAIGTFAEQFDAMLYLHLAVVVNDAFLPPTSIAVQKLLTALTFSLPYMLRPLGALLMGYLGDLKGHKHTIVWTTLFMAASCLVIAFLPGYQTIGIYAAVILMVVRTLQGFAALGEIVAAQLCLMEIFAPPWQYLMVLLVGCCADLGAIAAMASAYLTITYGYNWRVVFLLGGALAIFAMVLRQRFYPSRVVSLVSSSPTSIKGFNIGKKTHGFKITWAYLLMLCLWPIGFYLIYIYCSQLLKYQFGYTLHQILLHNLSFSLVSPLMMGILGWISLKVHPFKLMWWRLLLFVFIFPFFPFALAWMQTPHHLLMWQALLLATWPSMRPGEPIFFQYFHKIQRFRAIAFLFALAKMAIHPLTSIGFVVLSRYWGHFAIFALVGPILLGYSWGLRYFLKEQQPHV